MALTDLQIVARGMLAGRYLDDDVLMSFITEMQTDLLTCIGNTQPDDHKVRTTLYYEHHGLVDLLAHLTRYRAAAENIMSLDDPQEADLEDFTESDTD